MSSSTRTLTLILEHDSDLPTTELQERFVSQTDSDKRRTLQRLITHLQAVESGTRRGVVKMMTSAAKAYATVTCTQASAVNDTDAIVIGPTTLSVKASPANEDQWAVGASDDAMAAALVVAINAHSVLKNLVEATAAANVVTVRSRTPGIIGNRINVSESGNGMALGNLSGGLMTAGTNNDMLEFDFGLT